ncbi:ferritin-like domain-containing protein [Janthinobacterium sp.]|uniref:ferritin-like domain-containing protein n=1 Tax=Janthinobacterium sp. TaxID=1871054 RepID=UPI00293D6A11|nr:ferritin-like domain-containing protein [Janthinobacterium sp.]
MRQTEGSGQNRTGIRVSPRDSRAMQEFDGAVPEAYFGDAGSARLRSGYIIEADLLGSVSPPAPARGAAPGGAAPRILLDKLGERLAFERTSARLYDALITKCEATPEAGVASADLQEMRDDETRHFLAVAQAIEALGGDATSQTPSADLAGVETMGLVLVLNEPRTTVAQALHAILTAELADQAGWTALIALAAELHREDMVDAFTIALDEERGHLCRVLRWYEAALGIPAR